MKETLGERIGAQDGGDWVQTGTNIRAQDQVQQQNLASGRFSAQRKLELRKKLSKLIALEAEDKYISTTAMPQPAFETNNYKYLSAERGRNFGREPTEEFKKDTLMRMLNRRSSPAGVFNRTRLTSEMSYLIDVQISNKRASKTILQKKNWLKKSKFWLTIIRATSHYHSC